MKMKCAETLKNKQINKEKHAHQGNPGPHESNTEILWVLWFAPIINLFVIFTFRSFHQSISLFDQHQAGNHFPPDDNVMVAAKNNFYKGYKIKRSIRKIGTAIPMGKCMKGDYVEK